MATHNIQEATTLEDVGRYVPKICMALDNWQVEHPSHMIEVEGMINKKPIARSKHNHSWIVQLATGTHRKINELVKGCHLSMNGLNTFSDFNIIPLGFDDVLIGMDWLDTHHAVLDC